MTHQESSTLPRTQRPSALGAIRHALVVGLVLFAASNAWAFQGPPGGHNHHHGGGGGNGDCDDAPTNAPEINPTFMLGAAVLLVGGVLILTGRRRRAASCSSS